MSAPHVTRRPARPASAAAEVPAGGVFDSLDLAFWSLCRGPSAPLVLRGRWVVPGRRRPMRLAEARELLLWPGLMDPDRRDRVWAVLVRRAQTGDPSWIVGAAGVAVPGLRRVADRLTPGYRGDREDVEAEVLAGFLTALRTIDPDTGRVPARLCWAGYRAGLALRHRDTDAAARRAAGLDAAAPPRPWGHPDFVLAAAVTAEVITAEEAHLIGETRLEHIRLDQAAAARGVSRKTLLTRRNRAERRLVTGLRTGQVSTSATPPGRRTDRSRRPSSGAGAETGRTESG